MKAFLKRAVSWHGSCNSVKRSANRHPMPNKVTIHVQLGDAKPVRPAKTFGMLLMELRARMGLNGPGGSKFRSSLTRSELRETAPSPDKRPRG